MPAIPDHGTYVRYAIAAPNGELLSSDVRGMPGLGDCAALVDKEGHRKTWETEEITEALKYIDQFTTRLASLGMTAHFTLMSKTTTITTTDWNATR